MKNNTGSKSSAILSLMAQWTVDRQEESLFADNAGYDLDDLLFAQVQQVLIERGAPTITDEDGTTRLDFSADWAPVYDSYNTARNTAGGHSSYNFSGRGLTQSWSLNGGQANSASVSGEINNLLDFIAHTETGKTEAAMYNTVYNPAQKHFDNYFNGRQLTEINVGELKQWQRAVVNDGSVSSAAGAFQAIGGTFKETISKLGIADDTVLTPSVQRNIGLALLEKRGLSAYLEGNISLDRFTNNLAYEWASLKGANGKGQYDFDKAGNFAYGDANALRTHLVGLKQAYDRQNVADVGLDGDAQSPFAEAGVTDKDVIAATQQAEPQVIASRPLELNLN